MAKPWELRKQLKVIIVKVFLVIQQQANSLFGFFLKVNYRLKMCAQHVLNGNTSPIM